MMSDKNKLCYAHTNITNKQELNFIKQQSQIMIENYRPLHSKMDLDGVAQLPHP